MRKSEFLMKFASAVKKFTEAAIGKNLPHEHLFRLAGNVASEEGLDGKTSEGAPIAGSIIGIYFMEDEPVRVMALTEMAWEHTQAIAA